MHSTLNPEQTDPSNVFAHVNEEIARVTRLHGPPVSSVHLRRCHRLAIVLRQYGQSDYSEVGAASRDFITAAGKPGAPRATEPTYRPSVRGERSTSTTGNSDRPGTRRTDR